MKEQKCFDWNTTSKVDTTQYIAERLQMSIKSKCSIFNPVPWAWQCWWQHTAACKAQGAIAKNRSTFLCEQSKWKEDFWSTKHAKYNQHFKTLKKIMITIICISFKTLFLSKDFEHFKTGSWNAADDPSPPKSYSPNAHRHCDLLILKIRSSTHMMIMAQEHIPYVTETILRFTFT